MSTRCQIGIYEENHSELTVPYLLIYRHCDGYPEAPGPVKDIVDFCNNFKKERGHWDPSYIVARLTTFLIYQHTQDVPNQKGDYNQAGRFGGYLSYGVCPANEIHGDIEYYYAIYPDRVEVYKCGFGRKMHEWQLVRKELLSAKSAN